MKNYFITAAAFLVLSLASCSNTSKPDAETLDTAPVIDTAVKTAAIRYDCPMHPEIIRDKPGKCPVCKMTLVQIVEDAAVSDSASHADGQH